ncbi:MAG: pitrilysin family protein [Azospirillaceae bacterium]
MKPTAILAGLTIGLGTASPMSAQTGVFNPELFTLDNGLTVAVVTNRLSPVVTHMIWYGVGATDEPPGYSGLAHVLEHMMFKGTIENPDLDFGAEVSRLGGNDNAQTHWDYTVYFQSIAVDRLAEVMAMEAERMTDLQLDEAEFLTERDVVVEERRQRIDNDPSARLTELMTTALYMNHPYGTPIIGWEHEIAALEPADLQAFYETWYAPNNAVVVISGDIDAATARPLVEAAYGEIPSAPVPERVVLEEPDIAGHFRVSVSDPGVHQVQWRRWYLAPSYVTDPADIAPALDVAVQAFGGDSSSRMYRDLVVDRQLATSAGAYYSSDGRDGGNVILYATPRPDVDPQMLEQAIEEVVAQTLETGLGGDDVARAREQLIIAATYARDSVYYPARVVGSTLITGGTVEQLEAWPERIAAVDAEAASAALREILAADRSVTGTLLPPSADDNAS